MPNLVLKLVLTPALIGGSTLAGRRWGPAVGGWLVALPFTSAPVALFLALDHGTGFAARAATGMLAGTISQAVFCLAYSWIAQRGLWLASTAGGVGFAVSTAGLDRLALGPTLALLLTAAAIGLALWLMPSESGVGRVAPPPPRWDIPLRMTVGTGFVVTLTALAPVLGARLSGLLSPFPFFGLTLAAFAHYHEGHQAAVAVLRGLLHGLLAPAVFFFVLSVLLVSSGMWTAFATATAAALAVQGLTLRAMRR